MAAAYGGEARGAPIRRKLKATNSRTHLKKVRNKLEGLTNSVSGFGYDAPMHSGLPMRGESSLMTGAGPMMASLDADAFREEEQYRKETLAALKGRKKGKKGKKGRLKRPESRNSDLEKIYGNVDDFESSGSEYTLFSSASK